MEFINITKHSCADLGLSIKRPSFAALQVGREILPVSERGTSAEENGFGLGLWLVKQAEECVVLDTVLPEHLALVPTGHQELQRVFMGTLSMRNMMVITMAGLKLVTQLSCDTHMDLWVELDQEPLPLEAQLADLGPVEGVDFCITLGRCHTHRFRTPTDLLYPPPMLGMSLEDPPPGRPADPCGPPPG